MSILLLSLLSLVTPNPICITDLILPQKKALDMQNTMMKKPEFLKMQVFANRVRYCFKFITAYFLSAITVSNNIILQSCLSVA